MRRISGLLAPLALAGLAAAAPAAAQSDIGNLTDAERSAFRAEVRAYLLEHPEVIFDAIQVLEERRNEEAREKDRDLIAENADALFSDGYSYVAGNPDGDVTVVEFSDFRCPYCKQAHPHVLSMLEEDPNVRLIVKDYPILGPESVATARMAMAAHEIDPDSYPGLYDAMMSYDGQLNEQMAYRLAEEAGYDVAALKEAAASEEFDERVRQNYELGARLGIEGTPSFVIGDELVRGYVPVEELLATIAEQRMRASN